MVSIAVFPSGSRCILNNHNYLIKIFPCIHINIFAFWTGNVVLLEYEHFYLIIRDTGVYYPALSTFAQK